MNKKILSLLVFMLLFATVFGNNINIMKIVKSGDILSNSSYYEDSFTDETKWTLTDAAEIDESLGKLILPIGAKIGHAEYSGSIHTYGNIYQIKVECTGSNKGFNYIADTSVFVSANDGDYWKWIVQITEDGAYDESQTWVVPDDKRGKDLDIKIGLTTDTHSVGMYMDWIKVTYWWNDNQPPNQPTDENPEDGEIEVGTNAQLSVFVTDPEDEMVDVQFFNASNDELISGDYVNSGETAYCPWNNLAPGTTYGWYVVLNDLDGGTYTSETWQFTTTEVNQPPDYPKNPDPTNWEEDVDIDYDLSWTCSDPNGDPLNYDVYFEAGDQTPDEKISTGQTETTIDPGTMDYERTYYWKIVAFDDNGASKEGPVWWFETEEENFPPNEPNNPNPSNGQTNVNAESLNLNWDCTDPNYDELTYEVYLGTDSPPPYICTTTNQFYQAGAVSQYTDYYWKIKAIDGNGAYSEGPIWSFTTGNRIPNTPSDPDPYNGEIGVPVYSNLSWSCSDPGGDLLTYDIYFGTSSNPPCVATDYSQTTYDPPGLMDDYTKYYWKINAKDNHGGTNMGLLWNFTTSEQGAPEKPIEPIGPNYLSPDEIGTFTSLSIDPDADNVRLKFDWDDGTNDDWTEEVESGETVSRSHSWSNVGIFEVRAKAKDIYGKESAWSDKKIVKVLTPPAAVAQPAEEVNKINATIVGKITDDGGDKDNISWNFAYCKIDSENWQEVGWSEQIYSIGYIFKSTIDITKGEIYKFKAGVKNDQYSTWSEEKTFITPFSFVHITDPHVISGENGNERWNSVIENINNLDEKPKFVVCSGDLVDFGGYLIDNSNPLSGRKNYDALIGSDGDRILFGSKPNWYIDSDHNIPIYFCPGNHDYHNNFLGPFDPLQGFGLKNYIEKINPKTNYGVKNGCCAIYSMDTGYDVIPFGGWDEWWPPWEYEIPGAIDIPEGTGLTSNQIQNLRAWLDNLDDDDKNNEDISDYFKILIIHHPRINYNENNPNDGVFWEQRDEFRKACEDYDVDIVVHGHIHTGCIHEYTLGGKPWKPEYEGIKTKCILGVDIKEDFGSENINVIPVSGRDDKKYETILDDPIFIDSVINFDIESDAESYLIDGRNHYVGLNDEKNQYQLGIPGSIYSNHLFKYQNEEMNIDIEKTNTHLGALRKLSENYELKINSLSKNKMNLSISIHLKNGEESIAFYDDVLLKEDSKALIKYNEGDIDYNLYLDDDGDGIIDDTILFNRYEGDLPPDTPNKPSGPAKANVRVKHSFKSKGIEPDPENLDDLYFKFDWDDGANSGWLGPYDTGEECESIHSWNKKGEYNIRVKTKDKDGTESKWSEPLKLSVTVKSRNRFVLYNLAQQILEKFPILKNLIQKYLFT